MPNVYGYIYKITNTENNRVYIGQAKNGFEKRYGGLSINHVYKKTHNEELKMDIEKYNNEKFWLIEHEFDIAYSDEELNEKECSLFMKYVWDNMPRKKREDLNNWDNAEDENTWFSWEKSIPQILYNKKKPTHKKTKNKTKKYIYTTDKIPIVFTSQVKMKNYAEVNREIFYGKGRFPYGVHFSGYSGVFYIHWKAKWRLKNTENLPRIKNISRCFRYSIFTTQKILYSKTDIYKPLVKYTGLAWKIRTIYKPCRRVNIYRIEI